LGYAEIINEYPCRSEVLHLTDLDGVPVAAVVCKSTYQIHSEGLRLAENQQQIFTAGQNYGKPGESSYRYEPECAYLKPNTDVVLIGSAVPPHGEATSVDVEFSIGPLRKVARVIGNRFWFRGFSGVTLSSPEPFTEMPLVWERAFGGWDRIHSDQEHHVCDNRNPFGVGFQHDFARGQDQLPLPNVEDPKSSTTRLGDRDTPCGFGFIGPNWQPRASFAGTYDKQWMENRMPLLPFDFDLRFFNGAPPDLIANGYLRGNEPVLVRHCGRTPILNFNLPGQPPPSCRFRIAGQPDMHATANLDTVVVNTTEEIVTLTYRCYAPLSLGADRLREVHIKPSSQ
jgi:hypothetical protein